MSASPVDCSKSEVAEATIRWSCTRARRISDAARLPCLTTEHGQQSSGGPTGESTDLCHGTVTCWISQPWSTKPLRVASPS